MTAPDVAPPSATPSAAPGSSTLLGRLFDAALDASVVSFALWTLLYSLGLPTQWSLWPSGWLWLALTVGVVGWEVWRARRGAVDEVAVRAGADGGPVRPLLGERRESGLLALGVALIGGAGLGGLVWTPGTFRATWAALALGLAVLAVWAWVRGRVRPAGDWGTTEGSDATRAPVISARGGRADLSADGRQPRWATWEELGVLAAMAVTAVVASFIHLADTDDPYYVNRSVWIAEHGNAALRDTMFSPEVFNSPYGGGVPISSVEGLFGVIAHMSGQLAGTVTYLWVPPVAAALAVLAIWRLTRRWAARRAFAAFVVALGFLTLSGDSMLGNFWIPRIWQGKVIAVVVLMPLIWAHLTELPALAERRAQWRHAVLLLLAGVAFYGLTPTAVVWAPIMCAAVLLAAAVLRSGWLALGGLAMVVGPVLSGLAVVLFSTDVGGVDPVALPARASFVRILGETPAMVALGLLALGGAVALARRGTPAALAGASALASVWVFAPGVLPLINTVTGSGPILWRMLLVAPIPVLVGLLVTAPIPDLRRSGDDPSVASTTDTSRADRTSPRLAVGVALVPALVAVVLLGIGARPVWSHTGHGGPVTVTKQPEWKLDLPALADVELLVREGVTGTVLLPPRRMKVLTMYSTQAFPVVPREWFIENIEEPRAATRARRTLYRLASGEKQKFPGVATTREALERLDVSLACVGETDFTDRVLKLYAAAGYDVVERYGTLRCGRRA
ncbi:DUF6077 domain-containing protein [Nocardioides sp. R-C-SC26]|uniref:DUF6077 domain-containing protein n=1 Tax=Nocardioides sp. R-C-SC26 TaxID=2870414 RepID=UPI001E5AA518|nr:DUF6077 domain-containing protein [Nocardioides sp. R-C-SC26]